ncbi:MAG: beta-phosphoglucomutase [Bacillota bacterium]|nr:beta-phosphoglucomutase [Bacillota bacterium]
MIKAVIFDLDGVICSTDEFHYEAWKTLADRLGIYFDRKINERLRGVSRMDSLDIVLERSDKAYTPEEKLELATEKNECYKKLLMKMSPADLSDEVRETLLALREKGYPMAIGSSSKNTKQILKNIGLEGFFNAVSDGTNISRSKPDPEVFLCAAEYLGQKPCDCLVVEDADAGIIAAKRGGMSAAGIGPAAEHPEADYRLDSFSKLKEILF